MVRSASSSMRTLLPPWALEWLRDTRILVASEVIVVLLSTAVAILLARSLGPSSWGLFSALLGLALALAIFVESGIGTWLLRELSRLGQEEPDERLRARESAPRLIGGTLTTVAVGAAVLVAALVIATLFGASPGSTGALLGLLAYVTTLGASSCLGSYLRAERKLRKLVAGMLVERITLTASIALALLVTDELWLIGLLYLTAGGARLIYLGVILFRIERVPLIVPPIGRLRHFIARGIPFALNTVALVAIPKIDTVIVSIVSTIYAGYFALGDRIISPALFLPIVASTALYPFLQRESAGSQAIWRITGGMIAVGATISLVGIIASPWMIPMIFGEPYREAVVVVQIMLVALPFIYGSNSILVYLYTIGRERQLLAVAFAVSLLGTACLILLLAALGVVGAALGYVARQVLFAAALGGLAAVPSPTPLGARE